MTIDGWAFRTAAGRIALTINGRAVDHLETGRPRADLITPFAAVGGAGHAGFCAKGRLTLAEQMGHEPIEVQLVDPKHHRPLRDQQGWSVRADAPEQWPLPDGARIARVHGGADVEGFRHAGYAAVGKLNWALTKTVARGLRSFSRALDWGCGCGRLLRYMSDLPNLRLMGVDIDRDNVQWCRQHLPFASFDVVGLHPPSTLPSNAFDLVIGISVFTHLTELVQHEWLEELVRLMAPGGVAAVTIHGPTLIASSANGYLFHEVHRSGFTDGINAALDEVVEDKGYYRNAYHTHSYIRRVWSGYFDIVAIIPACIGNAQDLVIMRKP